MKSFIASLRNLILPFGATSGARIDLDGDDGVILVYDASDDVIGSIAPVDDPGGTYLSGVVSYETLAPGKGSAVQMDSGQITFRTWAGETPFVMDGLIQMDDGGNGLLRFRAPTFDASGRTAYLDLNAPGAIANTGGDSCAMLSDQSGAPVDLALTGTLRWAQDGLTAETWHAATLLNGGTVNGGDPAPRYRKLPTGQIQLGGSFKNGTLANGTHLFQLPTGYRPANPGVRPAMCNNAAGTVYAAYGIYCDSAGIVEVFGVGTNTIVYLDGVILDTD